MAGGSGRGHSHPIPPAPAPARPRRHCWVTGTVDAPGAHAGIVISWEKREDVWFALVVYFLEADRVLVQQWLPADVVTPADR